MISKVVNSGDPVIRHGQTELFDEGLKKKGKRGVSTGPRLTKERKHERKKNKREIFIVKKGTRGRPVH